MNVSNAPPQVAAEAPPDLPVSAPRKYGLLTKKWFWGLLMLIFFIALISHWVTSALAERAELKQTIAAMLHSSRADLAKLWHVRVFKPYHFKPEYADRLWWEPSVTTTVTMAITPRGPLNESEAIYMLYHGDTPRILFALSSAGVYVNDLEVNPHKYPRTLTSRPLTPDEITRLRELIPFIATHRGTDEQSKKYIWNNQVLQLASDILAAQQPTTSTL